MVVRFGVMREKSRKYLPYHKTPRPKFFSHFVLSTFLSPPLLLFFSLLVSIGEKCQVQYHNHHHHELKEV
jgi:hypothetical protein